MLLLTNYPIWPIISISLPLHGAATKAHHLHHLLHGAPVGAGTEDGVGPKEGTTVEDSMEE